MKGLSNAAQYKRVASNLLDSKALEQPGRVFSARHLWASFAQTKSSTSHRLDLVRNACANRRRGRAQGRKDGCHRVAKATRDSNAAASPRRAGLGHGAYRVPQYRLKGQGRRTRPIQRRPRALPSCRAALSGHSTRTLASAALRNEPSIHNANAKQRLQFWLAELIVALHRVALRLQLRRRYRHCERERARRTRPAATSTPTRTTYCRIKAGAMNLTHTGLQSRRVARDREQRKARTPQAQVAVSEARARASPTAPSWQSGVKRRSAGSCRRGGPLHLVMARRCGAPGLACFQAATRGQAARARIAASGDRRVERATGYREIDNERWWPARRKARTPRCGSRAAPQRCSAP